MIDLPGYQILALIYESANSIVYRATRDRDRCPVILKCLKQDYPNPTVVERYEQEYEIARSLKLDCAARAYELLAVRNVPVLVFEDFGGESLKILIASQKFTLLGFLNLALKIAKSLGKLHAAGIVHKDINPSNIVLNPATGQVKLIDFSISGQLAREQPSLPNPDGLEGTLAYMSPEQTGRTNRTLDYRTDLYSLGATFYELLTQDVPFAATDAMELVHCHLARQPAPPSDRDRKIPQPLSDIVLKLLAKAVEDRYQSTWGLVADLEECLRQFQAQGDIQPFALGTQDISDRFQIPQKLYGREQDIQTLLDAFGQVSQGNTEMMLVAGYSGIGKSALVEEISTAITRQKGYFIWGKFDQFQRSIPYSAIVRAFSELVQLLLSESREQLDRWREKLLAALGPNGQIIIDVIPEVEWIIGPQPTVPELGPTESLNRFNLVFQNFIHLFCQPEHPLVIFLDDLQWADSATLKLIELMMTDEVTHYLFLIGAYRDNEVSSTHPLMMLLERLRTDEIAVPERLTDEPCAQPKRRINQITLAPLNLEQITQLVAETLHRDRASVRPLAELIINKTEGNPFFVIEFLKTLYQENRLVFNANLICWQWNLEEIQAMPIADNVVELMLAKLQKLPNVTQQVLSLAACLGNQFELNTLSLIYEQESSRTFRDLSAALREGLIQPISDSAMTSVEIVNPLLILNYKFLHDRVQQAAYTLIAGSDKQSVHLKIGRMLLANTPVQYQFERVFELVDHLNVARSLIRDRAEQIKLAQLNLEAGKKAKSATAYRASLDYLATGIELLGNACWEEEYDLTFALYQERSEVESLSGNFERSEELIEITLEKAKSTPEKIAIYNILLIQYMLRSKYEEAVKTGRKALELLDISLQQDDLEAAIGSAVTETKQALEERDISDLLAVPKISDPRQQITVELLNNLAPSAYLYNPQLWTLLILKGTQICIQFGYAPESSFFYPTYGILLAALFGDYKSAYEFGKVALKVNQKWGSPTYKACASLVICLNYWFEPLKAANAIGNEGYQSALESGDLQYAGYLLNNKSLNYFIQGVSLSKLLPEIENYLHFGRKTENQLVIDTLIGLRAVLLNLSQKTANPICFDSPEIDEIKYLTNCQDRKNFYSSTIYQIFKLQTLCLYEEQAEALKHALDIEEKLPFIVGILPATEYYFYASLVLSAAFPQATKAEVETYRKKIESNQEKLEIWTDNCPENFQSKYLLVAAELARIDGKIADAIDLYDRAIAAAKASEFVQNEALSHERAAKFWLEQEKPQYAIVHLKEAYFSYQRWGATRKVKLLLAKYPKLRQAIAANAMPLNPKTTAVQTTSDRATSSLDLASVIKASQAISSEIVLEKLLGNLMKILIENAGAQTGFLLLPERGELAIAAEASVAEEQASVRNGTLVSQCPNLPQTVINFVERSRQDVVLVDACAEGQFTRDPYIRDRQIKSLLCSPILNQGNPIGILYLENNLTDGAFTPDRLEVLRMLSAQAAVSLDNALLYASVEQKVQARTQELNEKNTRLQQTLVELQRTQTQLIQSEKMSSLGQMVAGVAHEINNPVGFIYGNLTPASEYVQDLLSLIRVYQQEYPNPTALVEETTEEIDLDFIVEDLQKLLDSMKVGAERIGNIVLSLRNFSRLDEAEKKLVDLHEGIDNTLMILQPRLRASGQEVEIELVTDYGDVPPITCYPSQLNQVFMNILSNSIDALEEARKQGEQRATAPTITICTAIADPNTVQIRISDNGPGIPEKIRQRIFDPFFTTKPVGKGTGLGLSIGYSIVVERHGGELSCHSELGNGTEFVIEIPIINAPT